MENKKSIIKIIEQHSTATFWTRFVLWTTLACVLPFVFIAYRFDLFKAVSKIQIGGWGIVAILIVAIFVYSLLKYVTIALSSSYSFFGQCLKGICKVIIPLVALYVIVYNIRNNLDLFLQALGCVILCELVAIPLNPMPKWIYDKQKDVKDSERKEGMDYFLNEFFKRKNEEK